MISGLGLFPVLKDRCWKPKFGFSPWNVSFFQSSHLCMWKGSPLSKCIDKTSKSCAHHQKLRVPQMLSFFQLCCHGWRAPPYLSPSTSWPNSKHLTCHSVNNLQPFNSKLLIWFFVTYLKGLNTNETFDSIQFDYYVKFKC